LEVFQHRKLAIRSESFINPQGWHHAHSQRVAKSISIQYDAGYYAELNHDGKQI